MFARKDLGFLLYQQGDLETAAKQLNTTKKIYLQTYQQHDSSMKSYLEDLERGLKDITAVQPN